jgi:hypothetical protein
MKTLCALLVLVAACSKDNPYYCEQNPDHNCNIDGGTSGGDDMSIACTTADDCNGSMPACNDSTGLCVACTDTDIGACSGTMPVCSETNSCRACTTNTECTSGACMPDGSCATPDTLLYASPSGGVTTCGAADKCSLEQAITTADSTRKIVVLDPGIYTTSGTVSTTKDITILGRGATIAKGGSGNEVFNITSGAKLFLYYATIQNGDDNTLGHGINCSGSKLVAQFVTIQNNAANGVNATGCDVQIDRSTFTGNTAGAISLSGASQPFTVTNNFIYLNGSATVSVFGGVRLTFAGTASSHLEFNTIIDNIAKTGTGTAGGVVCGATSMITPNNIVARNVVGTSTTNGQVYGDCMFLTSKVQDDVVDLAFVNATTVPYNLRIGQTSTAKDFATTTSTVTVDFDGDQRPQSGQKDCGADEFK